MEQPTTSQTSRETKFSLIDCDLSEWKDATQKYNEMMNNEHGVTHRRTCADDDKCTAKANQLHRSMLESRPTSIRLCTSQETSAPTTGLLDQTDISICLGYSKVDLKTGPIMT